MTQYIDKDAVVAKIRERLLPVIRDKHYDEWEEGQDSERIAILDIIDTLEVKDPYEECIQYDSIKDGIQAHAEIYSFNIESELFNKLTKEQQSLWRKEIEQACISGGEAGVELARNPHYKENFEVQEVDLEKEIDNVWNPHFNLGWDDNSLVSINHKSFESIAQHFFELGMQQSKNYNNNEE